MENKNNLLIVFLILVILVLGGYFIYDVLIYEETEEMNDSTYTKFSDKLSDYDKQMEMPIPETAYGSHPISRIIITESKKAYAVLNETVIEQENMLIFKNEYLKELEDLGCSTSSNCLEGYYLGLDNVVRTYVVYQGNGGFNYICLLTGDGEVYAINSKKVLGTTASVASIDVYKLEELDNIVSIDYWYNDNAINAYATDINGNIKSLAGILK